MNSPEPAPPTTTISSPSLIEVSRCSASPYRIPAMPPDDDGSATTTNRMVIITFTAAGGVVLALIALSAAIAICYSIIQRKRESFCVIA